MNDSKDSQKKHRLGTVLEGLNMFNGINLAIRSDVNQDTYGKVTKTQENTTKKVSPIQAGDHKAAKNRQHSITKTNMKHT